MNRMMPRISLLLLIVSVVGAVNTHATGKVDTLQEWRGSLEDRRLADGIDPYLTNRQQFEKLWKAWRPDEQPPTIDFSRQLVLVATTEGSRLNLSAHRDDQGNLRPMALSTRDLRPGFRYVIATVNREGIRSVDGKPVAPVENVPGPSKSPLPKPGAVSWEELKRVIQEGDVDSVHQTHSRQVMVFLKGGATYTATEPVLDEVIQFVRQTGKNIPIATE